LINIITLPNRRQKDRLQNYIPGTEPDPHREQRELLKHGIRTRTIDLLTFPFNPLARHGTFYAGIDPLRSMRVLLAERRIDAICCGFESGALIVSLMRKWTRYKPKLIMFELNARGWGTRDKVLDIVMPSADGVMVLTNHQKIEAETTYKLKRPAQVVGFAIDDEFFRPGAQGSGHYIMSVGDDAGRDWATLAQACAGLPVDLRIRTSLNVPNPANLAISVLGRMSYLDLRDLYAQASFVVLPLRELSSPTGITSVLEAMAMGKAVIASNIGTTRDIIVDDVNGILVPPNDPVALRAAIVRLMHDPELRQRLGTAARSTIVTAFSCASHLRRYAHAVRSFVTETA